MSTRLRTILHPSWYQGKRASAPYFEGWYFKLVDKSGLHRLAVIPGVFKGPAGDEAFIQVFDGTDGSVWFLSYPESEFSAAKRGFDVTIGDNRFTTDHVTLAIQSGDLNLRGDIRFEDTKPWPVTLKSPGIMGWYGWLPFMQCYHGIVSLDHKLSGKLTLGQREMCFDGGRGYTEKDWGTAFPSAWIWVQSNHFAETGISLSASIAHIPWMKSYFPGFIVGFLLNNHLYRFATYTGARTKKLLVSGARIDWIIADDRYELAVEVEQTRGGLLFAPGPDGMRPAVTESLDARPLVRLTDTIERRTLFEGRGANGGVEVHGDTSVLVPVDEHRSLDANRP